MKVNWLLTIAAVLAWLFGLMLLFNSKNFEAPMGIDVTDRVATIAQAQGAILLGLGLINWMARGVTDKRALSAVLAGNLVVQLASLCVVARALLMGIVPTQAAPAVVIHLILGTWFALCLVSVSRSRRPA